MSIKWTERRFSKSLQLQEKKDFLARKTSILPSEPLEDMVSCPIHLGIFEDPIQLPCGHSFCLECVDRCLKTHMLNNNQFACPVCRIEWPIPIDGARGWPLSYALNDIISYVNEQKDRMRKLRSVAEDTTTSSSPNASASSSQEALPMMDSNRASFRRRNSVMEKADIVKKLANQYDTGTMDKTKLINELSSILKNLQENPESIGNSNSALPPTTETSSRRSSFDQRCETEIAREQMNRLCEYRIASQQLPATLASQLKSCTITHSNCIDFDEDPEYKKLVFVNHATNEVVVHDCRCRVTTSFIPKLAVNSGVPEAEIKPKCLRLFQDFVYLTGAIFNPSKNRHEGVLAKFSLEGKHIQASECLSNLQDINSRIQPIAGFDIDGNGRVFVALPSENAIVLISADLYTVEDRFVFKECELIPNQLCYSSSTREIWATCPEQRSILILDEDTGGYLQLGTSQLFNSSPSQIVYTQDNRVCFLDSRLSRIIWIKKQQGYLCIQKLSLSNQLKPHEVTALKKSNIVTIQAYVHSKSLLIVNDNGQVYLARPTKEEGARTGGKSCCTIS